MGNAIWCSAPGERLASAARDGDMAEARMLLAHKPCLAAYSAFASLNSPLHLAATEGHTEMVMLLLENGADVNSRNLYGQTALMQACRRGHWEVVQALLIFRANVTRAEYLSRKTALHFAASGGHIRCVRLLLADFVSSNALVGDKRRGCNSGKELESSVETEFDNKELSRFVNRAADAGVTALHMAAMNGHSDCAQLLLDLHADVSAVTCHYGSPSSKLIGSGSTPLHFAASEGHLKCCQILLARGASRLTLNYNGWLPVDVAKQWGHRFLEPLLSPNSELKIPACPPSSYLSLPLRSILNIARESRWRSLTAADDESDICAICLENSCAVAAEGCAHELCVKCALYLCSTSKIVRPSAGPPGSVPCPLCRDGIVSFVKLEQNPVENELAVTKFKALCAHHPHHTNEAAISCRSDFCGNSVPAVPSPELV